MDSYKDIPCLGSLLQELEANEDFHPLTSIKKMKPGEGLTKIWMCPSDELANILFKLPPTVYRGESINILKEIEGQPRASSGTLGSMVFDEFKYDDIEESSRTSSESWAHVSEEETELISESSEDDDRLTALRQKLKRIYKDKMDEGAEKMLTNSLVRIENQLFDLVSDIRKYEKNRVNQEIAPLMHFIEEHQSAVNKENSSKLRKKYRDRRRNCITRLIDVAEENFHAKCVKLEQKLKERFLYKVKEMKNQQFSAYRDYLKKETEKLSKLFTEEKKSIMEEYNKSVEVIKNRYNELYSEMKINEETKVKVQLEMYRNQLRQKRQSVLAERPDPLKTCARNSAWLCVMHQLLKDLEEFISEHVKERTDIFHLRKTHKLKKGECFHYVPPREEQLVNLENIRSYDSVPCRKRDETFHRQLIREAHELLKDILNDIAKSDYHKTIKYSVKEVSFNDNLAKNLLYRSDEDPSFYQLLSDDFLDTPSSLSSEVIE